MSRAFARFKAYLKENGLKATRSRELVFEEILSSPGVHPDAEEIYRRLRAKKKPVGLATIYRTLNLLVRSGLVAAIDLGESHSHFEPDGDKLSHGHIICLSCGRVQVFSHAEIQAAVDKIGKQKGYLLDKFSIQVFGRCRECAARRRAGKD